MAIVESADDAIISKDLNGIVTSWNHAAERMFGYRAEEMVGQDMHGLVHHHRPDGSPYPAEDSPIVQALRDEGGLVDAIKHHGPKVFEALAASTQ